MRKIILSVLISILYCIPLWGQEQLNSNAKSFLSHIEFWAYEDRVKNADMRWELQVSGGVGFPSMGAVNRYINWINHNFDGSIDHIDSYQENSLQVAYGLTKNLYVGVAYERFEAGADGYLVFMGNPHHFEIDLSVDGTEIYLKKIWPLSERVALTGTLGVGYYSSNYKEKENGYIVSGEDSKPGVKTGAGLTINLNRRLSVFLKADYRWLKFDKYKDNGKIITFVSPGNPPAAADFTGFIIVGGLGCRL